MKLQNVVVDGARSAFARGGRGKLVATRLDATGAWLVLTLAQMHGGIGMTHEHDIGLRGSGQGPASDPRIAVAASGQATVVWQQKAGGHASIFAARVE